MKRLLLIFVLLCGSVYAQTPFWNGILKPVSGAGACTINPGVGTPAQCAVDWTAVGINGGIPTTRTQCGSTLTPIGGGADDTAAIQAAIAACPADKFVLLGPGTFTIGTKLTLIDNMTLRGSGAQQTILNCLGTSASDSCVLLGSTAIRPANKPTGISITSGATAGSTSLILGSVTGVTVGQFLLIAQLVEPEATAVGGSSYGTVFGGEGRCTSCDGGYAGPATASLGQVSGTDLASADASVNPCVVSSASKPFGTQDLGTSIRITSGTGWTVGSYQINAVDGSGNATLDNACGSAGAQTGGSFNNFKQGVYAMNQLLKVACVGALCGSSNANEVTFTPALFTDYTSANQAKVWTFTANFKVKQGLEDLQLYSNNTGYSTMVRSDTCDECWVYGVEFNYADHDYIDVDHGFRNEIRDVYASNNFTHTAGGTDSDIALRTFTTSSLVVNSIVDRSHLAFLHEWGGGGNVFAYNYDTGGFDKNNSTLSGGFAIGHGGHPQFDLLEGNSTQKLSFDQVWGSSSHNTMFRNWARGAGLKCSPTDNTRGTVSCAGAATETQISHAIIPDHLSLYNNFVGNVAGSAAQNAYGATLAAFINWNDTRTYGTYKSNFNFGFGESSDAGGTDPVCTKYSTPPALTSRYNNCGCGGSYTAPCHSTGPRLTAYLYSNYTNIDAATGSGGAMPASFYLAAAPSAWWDTAVIPFPAIGPDVSTGDAAGNHAYSDRSNPAQLCYTLMGGADGAAGSPFAFDRKTCYTPTASPSVTSIGFADQGLGSTSAPTAMTLRNPSVHMLTIAGITPPAKFGQTNNCGSSLVPGASCTINVTFSPDAAASFSGTLAIATNDALSPANIALSGTGTGTPAPTANLSCDKAFVVQGSSFTCTPATTGDVSNGCTVDVSGGLTLHQVLPDCSTPFTFPFSGSLTIASYSLILNASGTGGSTASSPVNVYVQQRVAPSMVIF